MLVSASVTHQHVTPASGEQQGVASRRALALKSDDILFDQVTTALYPELVGGVLDATRNVDKAGMAMIVVRNDIAFTRESGARLAFFKQGALCDVGTAKQVINAAREARMRHVLQRVPTKRQSHREQP